MKKEGMSRRRFLTGAATVGAAAVAAPALLASCSGGNNKLTVKDASNTSVTIDASSDTANLIARDITTETKSSSYGTYKTIETSAFVTVHGINTPLCYNSNRQY